MSVKILKYELESEVHEVRMPAGAKILNAVNQQERIMVFAEADDSYFDVVRTFYLLPTGEDLPTSLITYVGTVLLNQGNTEVHVYSDNQGGFR